MKKIYVGKFVKTHGIKGEIKIISNFKYKEKVFQKNFKIYLGDSEFIIDSYRKHQKYDMITLKNITNINEILSFKGSKVYIDLVDLKLNKEEYLDEDLIGMDVVMNDIVKGKVLDIQNITKNKKIMIVDNKYVPMELVKEINFQNKKIILEEVDGLL